jgi:hypothetical protein
MVDKKLLLIFALEIIFKKSYRARTDMEFMRFDGDDTGVYKRNYQNKITTLILYVFKRYSHFYIYNFFKNNIQFEFIKHFFIITYS